METSKGMAVKERKGRCPRKLGIEGDRQVKLGKLRVLESLAAVNLVDRGGDRRGGKGREHL